MNRRALLSGLATVVLLGAGGAAFRWHLFGSRYRPTPYDDLLDQIDDRQPARLLGEAVLKTMPEATAERLAARLRRQSEDLVSGAGADAAQGRVIEIKGWILPRSVALYAALAASV